MVHIWFFRIGGDTPPDAIQCPKCGHWSGDAWTQCGGLCPMEMSPHYNREQIEMLSEYEWALAER